jgi:hypothetical protein
MNRSGHSCAKSDFDYDRRSISGTQMPAAFGRDPTSMHARVETHETALNVATGSPWAAGCRFHSEASQCSMRPLPTAVHPSAVTHEIEFRTAWGFGPRDQLLPFDCCAIALQSVADGQDRADRRVACDDAWSDHRDPFQLSASVLARFAPGPVAAM